MYAIVAIKYSFGPDCSFPATVGDEWLETLDEAIEALEGMCLGGFLDHNQYNTTYYVVPADDVPTDEYPEVCDFPDDEEDRVGCDAQRRTVADADALNAYLLDNYTYDDDDAPTVRYGEEVDVMGLATETEDGYPLDYDADEVKKFLFVCGGQGDCGYCMKNYRLTIASDVESAAKHKKVIGTT